MSEISELSRCIMGLSDRELASISERVCDMSRALTPPEPPALTSVADSFISTSDAAANPLFTSWRNSTACVIDSVASSRHAGRPCGENLSDEQQQEAVLALVRVDGMALSTISRQTDEICLAAVRQNGFALEFVKKQTPEICLAAVRQAGLALRLVEKQTEEICLVAVAADAVALGAVRVQTQKICHTSVSLYGWTLQFVQRGCLTPHLCVAAARVTPFFSPATAYRAESGECVYLTHFISVMHANKQLSSRPAGPQFTSRMYYKYRQFPEFVQIAAGTSITPRRVTAGVRRRVQA